MQNNVFKTQEDVLRYILAGGMVSSDDYGGPVIKLIDGKISLVPMPHYRNLMQRAFTFGNPSVWKPYKEPSWTDQLEKNMVLCFVTNNPYINGEGMFATIVRTTQSGEFIDSNERKWQHAVPCTLAQLSPYIYDPN